MIETPKLGKESGEPKTHDSPAVLEKKAEEIALVPKFDQSNIFMSEEGGHEPNGKEVNSDLKLPQTQREAANYYSFVDNNFMNYN